MNIIDLIIQDRTLSFVFTVLGTAFVFLLSNRVSYLLKKKDTKKENFEKEVTNKVDKSHFDAVKAEFKNAKTDFHSVIKKVKEEKADKEKTEKRIAELEKNIAELKEDKANKKDVERQIKEIKESLSKDIENLEKSISNNITILADSFKESFNNIEKENKTYRDGLKNTMERYEKNLDDFSRKIDNFIFKK